MLNYSNLCMLLRHADNALQNASGATVYGPMQEIAHFHDRLSRIGRKLSALRFDVQSAHDGKGKQEANGEA